MSAGNDWYRRKREAIVQARGSRCERCGGPEPFEFHHDRPTGLNGRHVDEAHGRWRGRGMNHRVLDLMKHPKAYVMLCVACHTRQHSIIEAE